MAQGVFVTVGVMLGMIVDDGMGVAEGPKGVKVVVGRTRFSAIVDTLVGGSIDRLLSGESDEVVLQATRTDTTNNTKKS